MKKLFFILLACMMTLSICAQKTDKEKIQLRYKYTLKNLKLNKQEQAQFAPVLLKYLNELQTVKSHYDKLKDQQKANIKKHKLTNAQGQQLLDAHWACDQKETEVKKKYSPQFVKLIGAARAYYAFDYSSDSMKKILGE